ncbi:MAG: TIGR01777 family protein [Chitinophagaceae bacterium]|nr:TIGR01777 family protein [Chitinophagaceae bacterium]
MTKILITGGTGLIGKTLTRYLNDKGYAVIILTRKKNELSLDPMIQYANWDIEMQKIDGEAISNADYIIHLAGAGVMDKRWSAKYKTEILESRTKSSALILKGLRENNNKVKVVVSTSAIGWYGEDPKPLQNKKGFIETDPPDKNFLGETCRLWEESIAPVTDMNIRLAKLRLGIVLSNDGGALEEFKKPLRFGIAAILGSGKQMISWIHIEDVCRMFLYAIENEISGSFNAVAPEPVTNKKLTLTLAGKLRKQFYIPVHVPQFILKLMLGQRSIEILKSATVSCEKIKKEGFIFLYPSIEAALDH